MNKHYYRKENDSNEIRASINDINVHSNKKFHALALSSIEQKKEFNTETIKQIAQLKKFRIANKNKLLVTYPEWLNGIMERETDLLGTASLFHDGLTIKEDIENYTGIIFKLYSY